MTSLWTRWRLKSPASRWFTQSLFRRRSKKTSKLRVTGLCEGNSPGVNSPHKGPVTRKTFPFNDVIMVCVFLHICSIDLFWAYIFRQINCHLDKKHNKWINSICMQIFPEQSTDLHFFYRLQISQSIIVLSSVNHQYDINTRLVCVILHPDLVCSVNKI